MGVLEWILVSVVAVAFIAASVVLIIRKKQGKSSCDCGGDCSHCGACKYKKLPDKK